MINIIKRLVSYIIIQIRYWNKLKFPISARIGVRSHFEGANRIYEREFFSGSMGYGSYIAAASYIAGKVGRFYFYCSRELNVIPVAILILIPLPLHLLCSFQL